MRKIIVTQYTFFILFLFLLSSCATTAKDNSIQPKQIILDDNSIATWTALSDDSFVYYGFNETEANNSLKFNKKYLDEDKVEELGSVPNFLVSRRQIVFRDPNIYQFISVHNDGGLTNENVLVDVNLEKNTFTTYKNNDGSNPAIPTYYSNGSILTLKNITDDTNIKTYIQRFNLRNKEWEDVIECNIDKETYIGDAMYGMCSNDEKICTLYDIRSGKEKRETFLKVYNREYKEVSSIKIDNELRDYIGAIADMQVFGDYIYLRGNSIHCWLARIEGDELIEIYRGDDFEISYNDINDDPMFFIGGTNKVYDFDTDTGKLQEYKFKIGEGAVILSMIATEKNILVYCRNDSEKFNYLISRSNLSNVVLPCK